MQALGHALQQQVQGDARMASRLAALCAGLHDGASKGGDEHEAARGANNQSVVLRDGVWPKDWRERTERKRLRRSL